VPGLLVVKRRTRKLRTAALESLTLAVEIFNRPSPTARTQGVLLNLQHAFEMLLKAVIWEDRKTIQEKASGHSYSFKTCLGIIRGMGHLDEGEAVVAATIDAHRDAVQHQGADATEERLYLDAASGLRLFDELLFRAFGERLADHPTFAGRMLPISAKPPRELYVLTSNDIEHIRGLLKPGQRRHTEANALLRTLMVSEQVASDPMGEVKQPTESQVENFAKRVQQERDWTKLLPGLARLVLEVDEGLTYSLRIVKKGDAPRAADSQARRTRSRGGDDGAEVQRTRPVPVLHERLRQRRAESRRADRPERLRTTGAHPPARHSQGREELQGVQDGQPTTPAIQPQGAEGRPTGPGRWTARRGQTGVARARQDEPQAASLTAPRPARRVGSAAKPAFVSASSRTREHPARLPLNGPRPCKQQPQAGCPVGDKPEATSETARHLRSARMRGRPTARRVTPAQREQDPGWDFQRVSDAAEMQRIMARIPNITAAGG
jgi:hypothetical protein